MRKLILALFLLIGGCITPPPFSLELCNEQCSQCEGIPCDLVCAELDQKIQSVGCREVSTTLWNCAIIEACEFPDLCGQEIDDFLVCEP